MTDPLEKAVYEGLGRDMPVRIGVAVSGGSDSLALLHVLRAISDVHKLQIEAATVDHGLRPGSADEAAVVAAICADWGIAHRTLAWRGWDGQGNLQDSARRARYALLSDWAAERELGAVALGHTLEDQAETVLMRLARRAGVDGLSAMAPRVLRGGTLWLRPCLTVSRGRLQARLRAYDIQWVDDPSNEDPRYDRIKTRQMLATLGALGLDPHALAEVASHMRDAREALEVATRRSARRCITHHHGALALDRMCFAAEPQEIQRRLLGGAIRWITGAPYAPRRAPLAAMVEAVKACQGMTLGGVALLCKDDTAWLFREYAPVRDMSVGAGDIWDDRWQIVQGEAALLRGARLAPLGQAGMESCAGWRETGLPHAAVLGHPALWQGDTVIASPGVKPHADWHWQQVRDEDVLFSGPL